MNDWAVAGFVSRVAERVTTAGEGLAAQLVDRHNSYDDEASNWALRLPVVEPSPEFVDDLGRRLMVAPDAIVLDNRFPDGRRLVYGVAAVGSLASAAVLVALILRNRSVGRAAA